MIAKPAKVDTWMPLMVDKYLGDTTHLNTEQHGAYLLLLMVMWKRDGKLPNQDVQLAQMARLTPARWKAHKPVLMEFFRVDGDFITQKRLSEELARAKKTNEQKSGAGKKGAEKRWHGDGTAIAEPSENDGTAIAEAWRLDAPIPIPIQGTTSAVPPHAGPGEACKAMKQAGLSDVNPSNPTLLTLLQGGVTIPELASAAEAAVKQQKGFAYALATAKGRRNDAAQTVVAGKSEPDDWTRFAT